LYRKIPSPAAATCRFFPEKDFTSDELRLVWLSSLLSSRFSLHALAVLLMATSPRKVRCPQCGVASVWDVGNQWRPFCSERCKMIDLGAWASEAYRLPVQETADPLSPADDTPTA
jgi:endogenous inhibitor of DNA gyrase (YacG/DUF329 family)